MSKPKWLLVLVYLRDGNEGLRRELESLLGLEASQEFDEGELRCLAFHFLDKKATAAAQAKIVDDRRVKHLVAREEVATDGLASVNAS